MNSRKLLTNKNLRLLFSIVPLYGALTVNTLFFAHDNHSALFISPQLAFSVREVALVLLGIAHLFLWIYRNKSEARDFVEKLGYEVTVLYSLDVVWVIGSESSRSSLLILIVMIMLLFMVYRRLMPFRIAFLSQFFRIGVSMYFGWASAAILSNLHMVLSTMVPTSGESSLAISYVVSILIAVGVMFLRYKDEIYLLTAIWVLSGNIYHGSSSTQLIFLFGMISLVIVLILGMRARTKNT